ncbi:hypothetical protein ACFFUT_17100 [Pseudohalocynthiibacter aestuariivivens]|uniref:Uncharacterized protein n=1 Tax=Pseudohalocynthiibacter aestuariivivens TaxID=1591409 RepID=A0ABV5JJD4_9RHOB|nr:hypothetical protein [Pseudohalocynthiibacter aestuariivivens]MBS9716742.1 hypothetical protein [Pseudohalocynthiibacter aestuariivivens]
MDNLNHLLWVLNSSRRTMKQAVLSSESEGDNDPTPYLRLAIKESANVIRALVSLVASLEDLLTSLEEVQSRSGVKTSTLEGFEESGAGVLADWVDAQRLKTIAEKIVDESDLEKFNLTRREGLSVLMSLRLLSNAEKSSLKSLGGRIPERERPRLCAACGLLAK